MGKELGFRRFWPELETWAEGVLSAKTGSGSYFHISAKSHEHPTRRQYDWYNSKQIAIFVLDGLIDRIRECVPEDEAHIRSA